MVVVAQAELELCISGLAGEPWQALAQSQLDGLAGIIASEREMEQLTAALVETQDRLVALFELSQAVRRQVGFEQVLDLLVNEARRLVDCTLACAVLLQPDQPTVIRQAGGQIPENVLLPMAEQFRANPNRHMIKTDERSPSHGSMLWVALPVRDTIFAALGLTRGPGQAFNAPDIKLARAISDQIGSQLENALLIQEALIRTRLETEMAVARDVQMALLPQKLPRVPGLDLAGASLPALQVGGDFFDVISVANLPVFFYMGDITGKGIPAALMMTMTRSVAHSMVRFNPRLGPGGLISQMNQELIDDFSRVGMFTTIFAGQYHAEARKLVFTNGGQSPILFAPVQGKARLLAAEDPPIGILDMHSYSEQMLEMKVGDVLLAATDGFNEAWNAAGEMFGFERLENLLDQLKLRSAAEISEGIFQAVAEFSGSRTQSDDRTLLVIKAIPMDASALVEVSASLNELGLVSLALRELVGRAVGTSVDDCQVAACEQALQELLSNQVRHACQSDASLRIQVRLSVQAQPPQVLVESEDRGLEYHAGNTRAQLPDPGLLQEGGYGMALIYTLMDEVAYQRREHKNYWKLVKTLSAVPF